MVIIEYAPKFLRQLKKLEPSLRAEAEDRIDLFKKNPNDPRFRVHKLHGALSDCWAFYINYKYRIIFEYLPNGGFGLLKVDDHDIYKSR